MFKTKKSLAKIKKKLRKLGIYFIYSRKNPSKEYILKAFFLSYNVKHCKNFKIQQRQQ